MPHPNSYSISELLGARLLLHMLYYHDELLRDFGADPLRKRGVLAPLKELLAPYQPSDYRMIIAGDWESSEGRRRPVGNFDLIA